MTERANSANDCPECGLRCLYGWIDGTRTCRNGHTWTVDGYQTTNGRILVKND